MGGLLRRSSTETKRLVREALRSVGPSPELVIDLETLKSQVQVQAGQIEDLARRLEALTSEIAALRTAQEELLTRPNPVPDLSGTVVGIGERVHAHEQDLKEIRRELERFGGAVLDDMALDRRLRNIEDRVGASGDNGKKRDDPARDPSEA